MKITALAFVCFTAACASRSRCGNPEGARIVYVEAKSCTVRIRQVTVGSQMHVPPSLKGADILAHRLTWRESAMTNGELVLGHFVFIPSGPEGSKR